MDGLTVIKAKEWQEVEEYAERTRTCIAKGKSNWQAAEASWHKDAPPPIYLLLRYQQGQYEWRGYIRLLPVGAFVYSDYFSLSAQEQAPYLHDRLRQEIWVSAIKELGIPCLVLSNSYGGREAKWVGPMPGYKRVNTYPTVGGSVWLVFPEEAKVQEPRVSTTGDAFCE